MSVGLKQKLLQINDILCQTYGAPFPFFNRNDPLSELVSAMLSHRTKNERTARAFANMKEKFPSWSAVKDADTEELVQSIYEVTFPGQKARRIQEALHIISERSGDPLNLDFLKELSAEDARNWLEKIPGVGGKTSAAVLNFSSLQIPALVVDSHHFRVATRLGLLPEKVSLNKAYKVLRSLLPVGWNARQMYDHHEAMMYHGQKCCWPQKPACTNCPVSDFCLYESGG